jgi:hypothetical protein
LTYFEKVTDKDAAMNDKREIVPSKKEFLQETSAGAAMAGLTAIKG